MRRAGDPPGHLWHAWPIDGIADALVVSAGEQYSCAALGSGEVVCWDGAGQLSAFEEVDPRRGFARLRAVRDAVDLGVDRDFGCALRQAGTVHCWMGRGDLQRLGTTAVSASTKEADVSGITDARQLSVGEGHACVVRKEGEIACWGSGEQGQLGHGQTVSSATPVAVDLVAR
jgi:alpha-tubulin suppressor-like RCC1 family protein